VTQGTTHGPTAHLAHLRAAPFVWPRAEKRRQGSLLDFTGQCWLWRLSSSVTFVAAALGLPTKPGVWRSWLVPTYSIKFLTTLSLKPRWLYFGTHEDKNPAVQSLLHNFSILVQSQGACLFCWAVLYRIHLFYVYLSHQKVLAMNKLSVCALRLQRPTATNVRATSVGTAKRSKVKLQCHC
jgi:hypothetical protein